MRRARRRATWARRRLRGIRRREIVEGAVALVLLVALAELPEERRAGPVEATAYYVVAEAITNVAEYARASYVSVSIRRSNGLATGVVTDDGVGGADPALGTGLRGLADRLEALNGHLEVDSPAARGTSIRAETPTRVGRPEVSPRSGALRTARPGGHVAPPARRACAQIGLSTHGS